MPGCSLRMISPLLKNPVEGTAFLLDGLAAVSIRKADSIDRSECLSSLIKRLPWRMRDCVPTVCPELLLGLLFASSA
jgi:hypothetical protein